MQARRSVRERTAAPDRDVLGGPHAACLASRWMAGDAPGFVLCSRSPNGTSQMALQKRIAGVAAFTSRGCGCFIRRWKPAREAPRCANPARIYSASLKCPVSGLTRRANPISASMPIGDRIKNASSMIAFGMKECHECSPLFAIENHPKRQHTVHFAQTNGLIGFSQFCLLYCTDSGESAGV